MLNKQNIATIRFKRNTRRIMEKKKINALDLAEKMFCKDKNKIKEQSELRQIRRLINYGGRKSVYIDEAMLIAQILEVPMSDLFLEYKQFDDKHIIK